MEIRNIYCIGRNYALHAKEMGNEVPAEPIVFLKPTHAAVPMDGRTVTLDGTRGSVHYEAEIVVRIARSYASEADPDGLIGHVALGIDFTMRDEQQRAKHAGLPWLSAKGFRHAAVIAEWDDYPGWTKLAGMRYALKLNGSEVQAGFASQMIYDIPAIIRYIGTRYGLGPGDVIFTGTPAGVGPVSDGDVLDCEWDGMPSGSCKVKLLV